jgi:hypothetical protein
MKINLIRLTITDALRWLNPVGLKRRFGILILLLVICVVSSAGAQSVTGTRTPNTIPQFTSVTTIGDSPIVQFNGNIGIADSGSASFRR